MTYNLCVYVTVDGKFYIGRRNEVAHLLGDQKVLKEVWKDAPHGIEGFFKKHQDQVDVFYQAVWYWAMCSLGRAKEDVNQYGLLRRLLSEFGDKLYRRVRNIAHSIAAMVKKSLPKKRGN